MVFWRRSCPSSKLNPRELVGGFERLAVGCFDGDADKRSAATGPQRSSNPHRAAVGIGRPAPSNCRARAQRNSSPLLSLSGSVIKPEPARQFGLSRLKIGPELYIHPYNVAQNEEGPSPFEPGPSSQVVVNYFLTLAFLARAADP
jgi:hypothetical protein